MTLKAIPVIPRTTRPSVAGAPVWYAEATMARTQLDINITIPTGDSRKLIMLWGSDGGEFPTAITFDPAGEALEMRQVAADANDALRIAAYYLDAPPSGSKMVRIETASAVWSVARLVVVQDARAGDPESDTQAASGSGSSILIEPLDAFSETLDLILDDTHGPGDLTTFDGQTPLNEAVINTSFLAAASGRTHPHNGEASMGWNTANAATTLLQVAVNTLFSAGQIATSGPLSLWHLDETAGTVFADANGISSLGLSEGGVAPGADPLLADGGKSLSVQNAGLRSSSHLDWQVPTWMFSIYCQPRSSPSPGSNRIIAARDVNLPPGGWSIEQYNDGGTSRLRAYVRNSGGGGGSAIWIGSQTGQGTLSLNVAHRIDLTFDGTTARLYLDRSEVASSSDASLYGMQDNAQPLDVAHWTGAGAYFDGLLDRVELREGTLSAVEIAAAPAPTTITDPGVPSGITAIDDPQGIVAPGSDIDVDVTANDIGIGAGDLNIDITLQPSAGVLSVVNDDTPEAQVRISTTEAPAQTTQYSGRYHVSEAGGAFSNEATISWSVQAIAGPGGYTPFPFVTTDNPPLDHTGVAALPGFSATDPRSASFIDPMSGLEVFRFSGDIGSPVFLNGTQNTGLVYPARLKCDNNPRMQQGWNADGTLLMVSRYYAGNNDPAGTLCKSYIVDVDGSHGASVPWRIIRATAAPDLGEGGSHWFWDFLNPLRAYVLKNDGMYEWWPIGAPGKSVGQQAKLYNWPSGFTCNDVRRGRHQQSYDGVYYYVSARRNSDGKWGGFRLNLLTGDFGSFILNPNSVNDDNDRALYGTGALGQYGWFTPDDNGDFSGRVFFDVRTGQRIGQITASQFNITHTDFAVVDGVEYAVGPYGDGFRMLRMHDQVFIEKGTAGGSNPNHCSTRAFKDTFENHGATGGSTSGLRYAMWAKSIANNGRRRGIIGVRLGANDNGVVRYICNHRGIRTANDNECHPHVSPGWEHVVFPSNWSEPGIQTNQLNLYMFAVIIPDAWYSPNNDGS
jgi:hypothetical protein